MIKIKFVDWGIANTVGKEILINKVFLKKKHKKVLKELILHELEHIKGNHKIDLYDTISKDLINIIIKNPKTWSHFLPFKTYDGRILYYKPFFAVLSVFIISPLFVFTTIKNSYTAVELLIGAFLYITMMVSIIAWANKD